MIFIATRNWSPDEHENVIDSQNREIASRNRAIKYLESLGVSQKEDWSQEDEPIII